MYLLQGTARAKARTDHLIYMLRLKPHIALAQPMAAKGTYIYRVHCNKGQSWNKCSIP